MKTENASDVCEGAALLRDILDKEHGEGIPLQRFHFRCIAHIINISVKECLHLVHKEIFFNSVIH